MSSCVKEAVHTATSPIVAGAKTLWNCIGSVFKGENNHREEFCECPSDDDEGEIELK